MLRGRLFGVREVLLNRLSYAMEHSENHHTQKKYEYYQGDKKLEGDFKVIGQF